MLIRTHISKSHESHQKMKFCMFVIFLCLTAPILADLCYKYNSYSGTYYTTYCNGYCAGPLGSEYCTYYYSGSGDTGSSTITIGASVGGGIGGLIFLCVCGCVLKHCIG